MLEARCRVDHLFRHCQWSFWYNIVCII